MEKVHIYHVNDLHSHFENWPKIASFLNRRKKEHDLAGEAYYVFDIGDHTDRFHPLTEASLGKINIKCLNELHFDAATIGNNEGITLPHDALDSLYDEAEFPVILSNLYDLNGSRPKWAKPYELIELGKTGITAAVLGVTVFYEEFYRMLGWQLKDPFESLKEVLQEVKGKAEYIILLSHVGITDDEAIAARFPEIDLILGSHTHHLLEKGRRVSNTLLCGAGKYGRYVGHVELDADKGKINETASVWLMEEEENDEKTEAELQAFAAESAKTLDQPAAFVKEELTLDWFDDSPLGTLLADALKEWCGGEVAMVNAGMLLEPLPEGPVTIGDLHRICPHPINPCKVELKGQVIREVILQAISKDMEELKLKGLGFRGKIMGKMVFSGIEVETEVLEDGERHVKSIMACGKPLDPERVYAVATVDMYTLGPLYPEIGRAKKKRFFMPEFLRDLLAWKLKKVSKQSS
ncbi:bifunctional metallophosphatase/5'-nucleotidase [Metabacillus sp. GX 13764]|uniref:bifunctional metallophosphatase/5'-nucleotidase n=1 Tax=Metabacillus kandeliae TaxID=2900151 RepID=UPI001E3B3F19|nr:bifunctional UDP-sugar hydrolase/5'-nucleotidase [Metabacillus kandeliae]MCD7036269.1 bifunctional metallophosphatase/5'-nucleotidase [Metabacillus kandeliae]